MHEDAHHLVKNHYNQIGEIRLDHLHFFEYNTYYANDKSILSSNPAH